MTVLAWALYVWDVFRNTRLPKEKRTFWAVLLVLLGPYAMPFYSLDVYPVMDSP